MVAVQADMLTSGVEGVQVWIVQADASLAMVLGYSDSKDKMPLFQ